MHLKSKSQPKNHDFYPVLKNRVIRYTKQMLSRQQKNGLSAGKNRRYLGYQHDVSGLFEVLYALSDVRADLLPALQAMFHREKNDNSREFNSTDRGMVIAHVARFLSEEA